MLDIIISEIDLSTTTVFCDINWSKNIRSNYRNRNKNKNKEEFKLLYYPAVPFLCYTMLHLSIPDFGR